MKNLGKFILKVFIVILVAMLIYTAWSFVSEVAERSISQVKENKAKIRMKEIVQIENGIRDEAVENGVAEYYIGENHERKFRWLKARDK